MMPTTDDDARQRRDVEEQTARLVKKILAILAKKESDFHVGYLTFLTLLSLHIMENSDDADDAIMSIGFAIERLASLGSDILDKDGATIQ